MRLIPKSDRQSGFTLLEVLVAIIVLAVGLLGLASLQATGLRFNQVAHQRTQATNMAYDMVDRMRNNRLAARDGDYNATFPDPAPTCTQELELDQGSVAARDIAAWHNALACILPSGNGEITVNNNDIATITVRWDDSRGEDDLLVFVVESRI